MTPDAAHNPSTPPPTVILWVHPRSTSTMFECILLNKQDEFRVLHEPMGDAWYFGPERVSPRYSAEECEKAYPQYAESTFAKTWHNIVTRPEGEGPARTFSKDMAQYILPLASQKPYIPASFSSSSSDPDAVSNPTLIPDALLRDPSIHHTFLIRKPEKAIPSYHKLCFPGSETGFEYFDPAEAGYRELRLLFDYLREANGKTPLVLESEALLADPKTIMELWCTDSGIEFEESMLEWNEGTREHFAKWPGFHTSAEQSKGVGKTNDQHITEPKKAHEPHPEEVTRCIEACKDDWRYLQKFARTS